MRTKNLTERSGKTVDQLVEALSDLIVSGHMMPGERLDELSLAARFQVSRTPVREALRHLTALRLVEQSPNRSAVVASIGPTTLSSMVETMAELEQIAARLAAERMSAEERHMLERLHRRSAQLVHDGNDRDYAESNSTFHERLYVGAHNEHLHDLIVQTRQRLMPFRRQQPRHKIRMAQSYREHDHIVMAILRGDCVAAGEAAYNHIKSNGDGSSLLPPVT
ncbi:GntR family transcriptional regulator [Rhizobium paknamense]|uniref:DNA-binding GntR family transcriptional regulator n=1 Tax=Rhizobium paknamense TaxID=1206817 RepID=A0ABU0IBJ7_9HYPH|nr:GntR family transcriptional regulator [Rhizobium paknamense]MDQ0455596.1 DNA-binding GntR family transcriptional regulator [Rhizobium paknamense]